MKEENLRIYGQTLQILMFRCCRMVTPLFYCEVGNSALSSAVIKVCVKLKFFIFSYENIRKTGKNAVVRFLISYLVPEILEVKMASIFSPEQFHEIPK